MTKLTPFPGEMHNRSPPIFNLNDDVVWYIFSFNADMEQNTEEKVPSLVTLWNTSQVCSHWRELAIGSPSLWARVININSLSQRGEEWTREVFHRTGATPLHIRAVDEKRVPSGDRYFLASILNKHWTRIQSLVVRLGWAHVPEDEYRWRVFSRPAPSLVSFRFSWGASPRYFTTPYFDLFDNAAPSLRTLDVGNMRPNLTVLSFPNLRNLVIHSPISAFDLLSVLSRVPFLESFELSPSGIRETVWALPLVGDTRISLPYVTLTRLTSIKFSGLDGVEITLSLLAHITPANGCALNFYGCYARESPSSHSLNLYRKIFSTYSRYCPELENAEKLKMTLDDGFCSFEITPPSNRHFRFGIGSSRVGLPEHAIHSLLGSSSGLRLDAITTLTLYLSIVEPLRPNVDIATPILSLVSVEKLVTDSNTLIVLEAIQSYTKVITFPALQNIHLGSTLQLAGITDFLDSRLDIGGHENTLTLWMQPFSVDLKPLEKYHGLRIQITRDGETFEDYYPFI